MGKDKNRAEKNAIIRKKILKLLGGKCCIPGCTSSRDDLNIHHRWYNVGDGEHPGSHASYALVKNDKNRFRLLCAAHHKALSGLFIRNNIKYLYQTRQNEQRLFNLIIVDASDGGSGLLKRIGKTRKNNIDKQQKRQERAKNPEKFRERSRDYWAKNRDVLNERARQERAKNPEKFNERKRQKRAENPEKFREYDRRYSAKNRDRINELQRKRRAKRRK